MNTSFRLLFGVGIFTTVCAASYGAESRLLPPPHQQGGKPLMEALRERRSTREFRTDAVSDQVLSDLLWAAFGINRPETGHRTAPSAMNQQEILLFVATAEGVYQHEARSNSLVRVADGDVRALTGGQPFSIVAPVALVFVADQGRMEKSKGPERDVYAAFDAGCVSQNVSLFCASAGLGTVVHEIGDRAPLAKAMNLRPEQRVVFAQSVGYAREDRGAATGK